MRIAQIAPLFESVPPALYGGTERVVSALTEALVRLGHDVVLFASGDSTTSAELIAPCSKALRLDEACIAPIAYQMIMLDDVFRRAEEFDVLHFHIDSLHFPLLAHKPNVKDLTTLHGRLDIPETVAFYKRFSNRPLVSISNSQRKPISYVNWRATIYHGIDTRQFHAKTVPGKYLAFLGRISPEKRVDRAIEIAKRTHVPLRIAAKVDRADAEYFRTEIQTLLNHPLVEYIGEIGETEKQEFLGNALALVFPIDWPEPFGLAMIEAMACGTPVIAFGCGAIPEVVDQGITGYVVKSIEEGIEAVKAIEHVDRSACRRRFEQRFSAERMALEYVREYQRLIDEHEGTVQPTLVEGLGR